MDIIACEKYVIDKHGTRQMENSLSRRLIELKATNTIFIIIQKARRKGEIRLLNAV
jgi:hypothetical protein